MATGGSIPLNRTQSVTFYNTCGVIEKDKNMYYVPRFSKTNATADTKTVCENFINALESVCPPSSAYQNITISQWSPEDRTLVVKGNIDDFRLVSDEGACLNYLIITRTVTKETTQTYYYGFFITDVEQSGGSSVRVTCTPDDFTNVFYLHNKKVMTQTEINNDYSPFNDYMKNCNVERQHYNRIKNERITELDMLISPNESIPQMAEGDLLTVTFEGFNPVVVSGSVWLFEYEQEQLHIILRDLSGNPEIPEEQNYSSLLYEGVSYSFSYALEDVYYRNIDKLVRDNVDLFLNPQENFTYRYQYRDLKYPICYESSLSNFTKHEMFLIENATALSDLPIRLREKVVKACLCWLLVETKGTDLIAPLKVTNITQQATYVKDYNTDMGEMASNNIWKPNLTIAFPFFMIPDQLSHIGLSVMATVSSEETSNPLGFLSTLDVVIRMLNQNATADYILSAYITKDLNIPDVSFNGLSIPGNTAYLDYKVKGLGSLIPPSENGTEQKRYYAGVYLGGLKSSIGSSPEKYVSVTYDYSHPENQPLSGVGCVVGLVISNYPSKELNLKLEEEDIPNLKNNYFDCFIEQPPYNFYSVSILSSYEMIFEKSRYYKTGMVGLTRYLVVNEGLKEGFIPSYTVENYTSKYFNEGLVYTVPSNIPLMSSSYDSYYNQNKAQMKNQYAISNVNFGSSILSNVVTGAISSIGGTLAGAVRGAPDPLSAFTGGASASVKGTTSMYSDIASTEINQASNLLTTKMTQKAKLADVGNMPDSMKQTGSNVYYDCATKELGLYLNHYTIDEISKNSICKLLERIGYLVNIYDEINSVNRVGFNYVKLTYFDWNPAVDIMVSQEEAIREIFNKGVTMLHDKSYLTSGHNYETIIE